MDVRKTQVIGPFKTQLKRWINSFLCGYLLVFCSVCWGHDTAELSVRFLQYLEGEQADDYESINAITCMLQDESGYMWFGGENGLARFNGVYSEVFRNNIGDKYSISGNYVWDLVVDHDGYIWIGTAQGLNRFDAARYGFIRYNNSETGPNVSEPKSLHANVVFSLAVASDNSLWLGTDRGVFRFVPKRNQFEFLESYGVSRVKSLLVDVDDNLWIGSHTDGLSFYNIQTQKYKHWQNDASDSTSLPHDHVSAISQQDDGTIWVGTLGGGIARLNRDDSFSVFQNQAGDKNSLPSDTVWDIHFSKDGLMWVGTDPGGLALFRPEKNNFQIFQHTPFLNGSLSSNKVRAIFDDALGDIWVGVFPEGVNFYDRSSSAFTNYVSEPGNPKSLSDSAILTFFEDSDKQLWLGTEGGLNLFNRKTAQFTSYRSEPGTANKLQADAVLAIAQTEDDELWVGTWSGGVHRFNKKTEEFVHYGFDPKDPNSLGGNYVWSMFKDSKNRLWLGTETAGLHLYQPETDNFRRFSVDESDPNSILSDHIWVIFEDSKHRVWFGTADGLELLESINESQIKFKHYRHSPSDPTSLSGNRIISLYEDSRGTLWVGTSDAGLNKFDPESGENIRFGIADGLPSMYIASIIEDDQNQLWVTTVNGVAAINLYSYDIKTFSIADGLVGNNYHRNATYKDEKGHIYLGGSKGLSIFDPQFLQKESVPPPLVLGEFRLFNEVVRYGDGNNILKKNINDTDEITLTYKDSMFAFDFYALSYGASNHNEYAYMLVGFDKTWNYVGNKNTATYTNIDPGEYVFKVKAANSDGVWNTEGASIKVIIQTPPWASVWAYILYALMVFGLISFFIQNQKKKLAFKHQKSVNEKLIKLDRLKDAFLANTSHELRTPLNGIIGLAESMLDGAMGELNDAAKHSLGMISQSGRRLSNLINDILDHSKLNENKLDIQTKAVNLYRACAMVMELSAPLVGRKPVRLVNEVPEEAFVLADENRLQQILHNLIGNAIKFTKKGVVTVKANLNNGHWVIDFEDTGVGIAPQHLQGIFSAFTQLDNMDTREQGGTGLGLAITKQLVELHHGTIEAFSTEGKGSLFRVALPAVNLRLDEVNDSPSPAQQPMQNKAKPLVTESPALSAITATQKGGDEVILVVDDDGVNRMVIKSMLAHHKYSVIEAENGPDALAILASGQKVDLVILDVMMPKMSGYEVCMRIRVHHPIERLPVLFLTAKTFGDDLIKGFVSGGNSYLTKPVEKHQLLTRVLRHIAAAKTNEKLVDQIERTESKNRASLLGLDAMEGILLAINHLDREHELLGRVAKHLLKLCGGQNAYFWRFLGEEQHYSLTHQFDTEGNSVECVKTRFCLTSDLIQEMSLTENAFVHFDQANIKGTLCPLLVSAKCLTCSYILPVHYNNEPLGLFMIAADELRNTEELGETLNRIKAHVVAAVVKAFGR